jgi:hypothetical protein
MKNLIIGNTCQLARYFPQDYIQISSRNIDIDYIKSKKWKTVYLCFAEQRTYLANENDDNIKKLFWDTNYTKVKTLIDSIQSNVEKIVYYSTAELWNNKTGPIDISMSFDFHHNYYTESKASISEILKNKNNYPKVIIAYPFNFNSVYRKGDYLFAKIFRSIIEKNKVIIGDTFFYRDILHPKMVVEETIKQSYLCKDLIIGSGRLCYIDDFIKKLYNKFNLNMDEFVIRKFDKQSIYRKCIFYSSEYSPEYEEEKVLDLISTELKGINYE